MYTVCVVLVETTKDIDESKIPAQATMAINLVNLCLKAVRNKLGEPSRDEMGQLSKRVSNVELIEKISWSPNFSEPLLKMAEQQFLGAMHGHKAYKIAMSNMAGTHKVFVTVDGYIGVGPPLMQEGDLVCCLYGLNIPLVIRKHDALFKIVGDWYIHGMMFGERMSEAVQQEITLC